MEKYDPFIDKGRSTEEARIEELQDIERENARVYEEPIQSTNGLQIKRFKPNFYDPRVYMGILARIKTKNFKEYKGV